MKIILLNGAPFSGKDTLANRLVDRLDNTEYVMFKQPLYERFAERHNLPLNRVKEICDGHGKDKPNSLIGGLVPRAELIDISENEIKKQYGDDGVAKIVCDNIRNIPDYQNKTIVFPDSGFPNELVYLQSQFPQAEIILIRILRDGCDFKKQKDSRSYLPYPNLVVDNNKDETEIPKEHRGYWMLEQYLNHFE